MPVTAPTLFRRVHGPFSRVSLPAARGLSLVGQVPFALNPQFRLPGNASLAITTQAPTFAIAPQNVVRSPPTASLLITAQAPTSTVSNQTIFFTEAFANASWGSRGWYDDTGGTIDSSVHAPGSASSLRFDWTIGSTTPAGPGRILFTPSSTVYASFYMKLGSATNTWVGSGQTYHPHFIRFFTDDDVDFVSPNFSHCQVGVEMSVFKPRFACADSASINVPQINVNLLGSATTHAVFGGNGSQNASESHYFDSGDWFNSIFFDAASSVYTNNTWHFCEVYVQMNTLTGSTPNANGILQHWVDGVQVINLTNLYLISGTQTAHKFEQFAIQPYIGDGSPAVQSMWIDTLTVADRR